MFQLRNPANPAASTHAGVLEFIAEEGVVHLAVLDDEDTKA
jgi:ubiquitin fusion degradation protein 1